MTIIPCDYKPPEGGKWYFLHYTLVAKLNEWLAQIKPDVVYLDKSGSYWAEAL